MTFVQAPFSRIIPFLLAIAWAWLGVIAAGAAGPAAPSNLRGSVLTSTSFNLAWDDNSTDETNFEMLYKVNGGAENTYSLGPSGGTGTLTAEFSGFSGWNTAAIRIRATNAGGSTYSNTVNLAFNTPYNPPTSPLLKAMSDGSFLVMWTDNASAEAGYSVEIATASGGPFTVLGSTPGSNYTGMFSGSLAPSTTYYFRIRAFKGSPEAQTNYSTYTSTVSGTTPDTLAAPTGLGVSAINETSVNFTFTDNTALNSGYEIDYCLAGTGAFQHFGDAADFGTLNAPDSVAPGTAYDFRIRAYYQQGTNPRVYSGYSSTASATTPFYAPTGLSANATSESAVNLTWTNHSQAQQGVSIYYRLSGTGNYTLYDYASANATSYSVAGLAAETPYNFQVAAVYERTAPGATTLIISAFSNNVTAATPFYAPTGLSADATSESAINLTWTNHSAAQRGVSIYYCLSGTGNYTLYNYASANATSYSVGGLSPGTPYAFQVAAAFERTVSNSTTVVESSLSNNVTATTKDAFISRSYQPITFNQNFSFTPQVTTASERGSWDITGLPAGLSFNGSTGLLTGAPTETGVFDCPMTATFANGWTTHSTLTLRIIRAPGPPVTGTTITSQTLNQGENATVSLTDKFSDPDAESAVRVITNLGTMDFILYNSATPQTVANFLAYVNNPDSTGNFNGAVFHRSIAGFVIQGGAFKVQSAPDNFYSTTTLPSPLNEPGISNVRGTVGMAKVPDDPDSATDQFFVNLADNSSNLDNQNGGFTAFGRVAGVGMQVADTIAALPTINATVNIDGSTGNFSHCPFTSASASMDTSKVVSITSVAPVPVLSYSVTENTDPAAVNASIDGNNLLITGLSGGESDVTVTATDLDGNPVSQTFSVVVNQAPAFTSSALPSAAEVGSAYQFTCTASGWPSPTFSVTAGSLPDGLTLASNGTITGTPTNADRFTGTITATNLAGTATQDFDVTVTFTYSSWASGNSLSASNALPGAAPFGDGVPNLHKYAFNMNGTRPDVHRMIAGSNSGLPAAWVVRHGPQHFWHVEYVRRKGAGITYAPKKSGTLAPSSFVPLTAPPSVTTIDAGWERVVVEEEFDPVATTRLFSTVEVTMP